MLVIMPPSALLFMTLSIFPRFWDPDRFEEHWLGTFKNNPQVGVLPCFSHDWVFWRRIPHRIMSYPAMIGMIYH